MIKNIFKAILYKLFYFLSKINTSFFSDSLIAWGYLIKNQAYFNTVSTGSLEDNRFLLHEKLSTEYIVENEKIHFIEFGVRWGQIINRWARGNKNLESSFHGFDTFTGIPEAWGSENIGTYSNKGHIPEPNDERVKFHVGLVQSNLEQHIKTIDPTKKLILHFDFDIYSATLYGLVKMQPLFKKGDVLMFDEFFSITKNHHEYRAFLDFLAYCKIDFKVIHKYIGGQFVIELT
jgi:O-methyltransferase